MSLSIFKIYPKLTLNSAYKKYTVFQFLLSIGLFGYYGYRMNKLR